MEVIVFRAAISLCRDDDALICLEDAAGEIVGAQILPYLLNRVQCRLARGEEERCDVLGPD
jgi:hypothetical protein